MGDLYIPNIFYCFNVVCRKNTVYLLSILMDKKTAYKIVLFFLILALIDQVTGRVIAYYALKYKHDKRIGLLIDNQLEKEVLILGSSRALNGIDPETIEKETHLSCYNLALSGSNVTFHETMLDLIIQSKKHPKNYLFNFKPKYWS